MPITNEQRDRDWPLVRTRLRRAERDYLNSVLRSEGITFAEWIRRNLSTAPAVGAVDPNVEAFSMKAPREYLKALHDAAIQQADAMMAIAALEQRNAPMDAAARRRAAGRMMDAAGWCSGGLAKYARRDESHQNKTTGA